MNILPKKRWHVRTKENIARVRRDEAKAKEEEEERIRRIELAEKEARTELLRAKARSKYDGRADEGTSDEKLEHVNFFKELELGEETVKGKNKEHERETKEEKEKYEKQIGYLTYLGQDTVESTGKISWFNKVPDRLTNKDNTEVETTKKSVYDPLEKMNMYLGNKPKAKSAKIEEVKKSEEKKKRKHKKKKKRRKEESEHRKKSKKRRRDSESEPEPSPRSKKKKISTEEPESRANLEELRAKRLLREEAEKKRAAQLLAKMRGEVVEEPKPIEPAGRQKYNSQFNPHIARQNRDD
ncbi:unnamed protein product [Nesidiocoris tenuis]|uniref:CBF1-interacting co-repressor CIR N-terminal domain-containing protein n=1 Tax=Nesidiocoris tenuis TaxID=355587 RepID=A0A6H5GPX8_9HEMI|nr:unnamed protein product [Nesidiocoris tenuis]